MMESEWLHLFVPGRLCLFGEHSDWAGTYRRFNSEVSPGVAIVCSTAQGCYARVRRHPNQLRVSSTLGDGTEVHFACEMKADLLLEKANEGGFFSYAAGVAYEIISKYKVKGLEVHNYKTDLPIKKGLSSSAAFCVLIARAFNRVYDLKCRTEGEMDLAYHGEIRTPSRCGRLDQCCAFGQRTVLMRFDGDTLDCQRIRVREKVHAILINLNASKDTKKILGSLNACYPFPSNDIDRNVHKLLGPINAEISNKAIAILNGENLQGSSIAEALGALMSEAQRHFDSYAMPACPEELTSPKLHSILAHESIQSLIYGGKGVGSQGDGSAQLIAKDERSQDEIVRILEAETDVSCMKITLGNEQRNIFKAVVLASSGSSAFFPASRSTGRSLFPIVSDDGIARPLILPIIEEILAAGIEEVIIVIRPQDRAAFESIFYEMLPIEEYNILPKKLQQYHKRIRQIGENIKLIEEKSANEGDAHALLRARETISAEAFLCIVADRLWHSKNTTGSCISQMLNSFSGSPLVAFHDVGESDHPCLGMITTEVTKDGGYVLESVGSTLEVEYAERIHESGAEGRFGLSGIFAFDESVLEHADRLVKKNARIQGQYPLWAVLQSLMSEVECQAVHLDADIHETSSPKQLVDSLNAYLRHTNRRDMAVQ